MTLYQAKVSRSFDHQGDVDGNAHLCAVVQDYLGKLAAVQAKGDDYEIAAAQIGVEVYSAMSSAVGAS